MPADLFTDLLLASLVISLSPIPIIAITLVLSTARARANGLAFSGGWLAGLLIITTVLTWLVSPLARRVTGISLPVDAGVTIK